MSATVSPGSTLAGYRVEALLGRGGMGVVYRATDLRLDRAVALKLVAPELAQDDRFRSRFLKESRLAASLDHPNVLPIFEAGESDGQLYLAMRYVEGDDLKTLLERDRTLTPERTVAVLSQIADALDAAHRRGLVHRDVKPANILVDEDGHAYLTDFGITKQAGAPSTQTGEMVGTLDYLAPEQIRGEPVDGRTDSYALGCVLYECLAGAPPFRRETHAETLWAHLHDEPPPLGGHSALDPVLARALAKEPDARFAGCRELIDAAGAALGHAAPAPVPVKRRGHRLVHRRRAILAAGLVLLGATVAALIVALTGGGGENTPAAPAGNGVAAIEPRGDRVASFIDSGTAPSNVAVGEGAVWVMSADDRTIARIDPRTLAVTGKISTRGRPSDIAAGLGWLWVGNGGGGESGDTVSIARVDPRTGAVTHSARLPNRQKGVRGAGPNWGYANIAIGDGAVWALDPDQTIARIDPKTGKVVATVPIVANRVAAGDAGVWALVDNSVVRINPRTNRPGQKIELTTPAPTALAVGGGKVWATAEQEGVVWKIDPGPFPVARTIPVGVGVTYIAYGAGALWAANFLEGTVSRIDAVTNKVTHIPVEAAQALAAGAGSAWVSSAGAARPGTLPASTCHDVVSGGGTPDVLIASDLPLQKYNPQSRPMVDAIRLVLRNHRFRAGKFSVGYRSCDDSTAQTGFFEPRRCAANANAYARANKLVGIIGPYNSDCAAIEIPILNRAPGGPLAIIGPTTTYAGLTRDASMPPPDGFRNEPRVYYPTGVRNFVRLVPGDDQLAAGQALLAKQLGLKSVYVLDDGSGFWKSLVTGPFQRAARRLGLRVAGSGSYNARAVNEPVVAARVARSGAQGVMVGGFSDTGGNMVRELRKRLGQRVTIFGSFDFTFVKKVLKQLGPAVRGMYIATIDLPRANLPLDTAGRQFATAVGQSANEYGGVLEAGQATELLLQAIARSDGSRASVLREVKATKVSNGILGSFFFDANGDISTAPISIVRVTGTTRPGAGLPGQFKGSVLDRVLEVPASLGEQ